MAINWREQEQNDRGDAAQEPPYHNNQKIIIQGDERVERTILIHEQLVVLMVMSPIQYSHGF